MRSLLASIGILIVASSCGGQRTPPPPARGATTPAGRPIGPYTLVALLTPEVPFITANARVEGGTTPGEVRATISLSGSDPGRRHPWHIHPGSCQAREVQPVGPAAAYRPLDIRADGKVDLTQSLKIDINPLRSYYVDVHLSNARMDLLIACGNLNRQ